MTWPVVLIVFTPEIPATSMVLSMNIIKKTIVATISTCAEAERHLSVVLSDVSIANRRKKSHRVSYSESTKWMLGRAFVSTPRLNKDTMAWKSSLRGGQSLAP